MNLFFDTRREDWREKVLVVLRLSKGYEDNSELDETRYEIVELQENPIT